MLASPGATVTAFGHDELVFITGESQRRSQILIGKWPVAEQVIQIILAILQVDLQGFGIGLCLAHQSRIGPATADVCKTADVTEHSAKLIWPFPSDRECADATR